MLYTVYKSATLGCQMLVSFDSWFEITELLLIKIWFLIIGLTLLFVLKSNDKTDGTNGQVVWKLIRSWCTDIIFYWPTLRKHLKNV